MKHLLVSVSIVLTISLSFAQSDGVNKEKYWKFRNDLKEKFIKIGPNEGERAKS